MMGTFSIWHWLVVLAIVVLVFGTKKLRNLGGDLGSALKGFKEGMKDSDSDIDSAASQPPDTSNQTIEGEVKDKTTTTTFKQPPQNQTADSAVEKTVNTQNFTDTKNEPEIVNITTAPGELNNLTTSDETKVNIQTKG